MKRVMTWLLAAATAGALATIFVYSGTFNVAADVPHSALTSRLMEVVRDRSIAARVKDIEVPKLDDSQLIAEGAEHYAAMCADCHLAPGVGRSDIRDGLYPAPPNLTERIPVGDAEMFWVIKHGIKMSAMPAWGRTHDDPSIWGLVAFVRRLPELSSEQYQALVKATAKSHRHHNHDGHDHHGGSKP